MSHLALGLLDAPALLCRVLVDGLLHALGAIDRTGQGIEDRFPRFRGLAFRVAGIGAARSCAAATGDG